MSHVALEHFWAYQAFIGRRRIRRHAGQKPREMRALGGRIKNPRIFNRSHAHDLQTMSDNVQLGTAVGTRIKRLPRHHRRISQNRGLLKSLLTPLIRASKSIIMEMQWPHDSPIPLCEFKISAILIFYKRFCSCAQHTYKIGRAHV